MSRTHDCQPTLDDAGVLAFCKNGYMTLEAVVPDEVNRRTIAYLKGTKDHEPSAILREQWFLDAVILNPAVAGAVRSLLGKNFGIPVLMSLHRRQNPIKSAFGWHVDGGSKWRPSIEDLQVFYYPQDTPEEMGPTHLVPGSHLVPNSQRAMGHYGTLRHERSTAARAGSIFITMYRIWHRASSGSATGVRELLKYCYWRTAAPQRDWPATPGFDPALADYSGPAAPFHEQFGDANAAAEMYMWLCGKHEHFRLMGGQSWPVPAGRIDEPYGFPEALRRTAARANETA